MLAGEQGSPCSNLIFSSGGLGRLDMCIEAGLAAIDTIVRTLLTPGQG